MSDLKQYLVDTNAVRYRITKADNIKKPARRFWSKAMSEVANGEAVILVPKEVIRELENQSYSFRIFNNSPELENISDLLEFSEEIPNITSDEIEDKIIKMSAYVTAKYRTQLISATGVQKLKYPSIPDARILCTAWQRNCVMVTGNISDFALLPLLEEQHEGKLYNIISESFINIPQELHLEIHSDQTFKTMFQELVRLIEANET